MVVNGAANRDPGRFEHPDDFEVERANARHHIAFGHGAHTCPGAPLARAEGRITIERLLDRMDNIRISEKEHGPAGARRYDYVPTYILRGVSRLHLEFEPRVRAPPDLFPGTCGLKVRRAANCASGPWARGYATFRGISPTIPLDKSFPSRRVRDAMGRARSLRCVASAP